jgi:hypothetical protein
VTPEVICLAIVLGASSGAPAKYANPSTEVAANGVAPNVVPSEIAAMEVSARLRALLADRSPTAAIALRERVRLGAPPAALIAFLDAYGERPRAELLDVVRQLAQYRRVDVRAHALGAWAQTGPHEADLAIAAAADDVDAGIRRLAVALAERHPSPAASSRIADLLDHDRALAEEVAARGGEADDEPVIEVDP